MEYHLEILPEAGRSLSKLDRQIAKRILRKLAWLVENTAAVEHVGLHGRLLGALNYVKGITGSCTTSIIKNRSLQ